MPMSTGAGGAGLWLDCENFPNLFSYGDFMQIFIKPAPPAPATCQIRHRLSNGITS